MGLRYCLELCLVYVDLVIKCERWPCVDESGSLRWFRVVMLANFQTEFEGAFALMHLN